MDFAGRLRELMGDRGIGVRELGRRVYRDKSYISRLASGKQRPSPEAARDLDAALSADGELAALARPPAPDLAYLHVLSSTLGLPASVVAVLAGPESAGEGDDVDRRAFNAVAMGLVAGMLAPAVPPPSAASAADVRRLRHSASELWARDWTVGGSALLREAIQQYALARAMLDQSSYTAVTGRELQAVSAELAACGGFIAFDAGAQPLARNLLSESALLAGSLGDPVLTAHTYTLLAMQSTALAVFSGQSGPAREALRFLDHAADVARHEPSPRIHATIWMRRATASAVLGDETEVRRGIACARRELDRGDHPADPHWAAFVTPSEVTGHEAMARLSQGRAETAAGLFRDVIGDPQLPPRNRAFYQARMAWALVAGGDRTEAISEGLRVLPALEGPVKSARTLSQLRPVRRAAAPDSEFAARFDAVASRA